MNKATALRALFYLMLLACFSVQFASGIVAKVLGLTVRFDPTLLLIGSGAAILAVAAMWLVDMLPEGN